MSYLGSKNLQNLDHIISICYILLMLSTANIKLSFSSSLKSPTVSCSLKNDVHKKEVHEFSMSRCFLENRQEIMNQNK